MPVSQIPLLPSKPTSPAAPASQARQDSGADSHTDDTSFKQQLDREIDRKQAPKQVAENAVKPEKTKQKQPHNQEEQGPDKHADGVDPSQAESVVAAQVQAAEPAVKAVTLDTKPSQQEQDSDTDKAVAGMQATGTQVAEEAMAGQLIAQGGKDMPAEPPSRPATSADVTAKLPASSRAADITVKTTPQPQTPAKAVTPQVMEVAGKTPDQTDTETGEGLLVKSPEPGAETRRTQLFKLSADVEASTQIQKPVTQVNSIQQTSAAFVHTSTARPADTTPLPNQAGASSQPPMQGSVQANVSSPQWQHGLGEQMSVMVSGKFHSAELKLHPAHLGPLEVKLHLHDDNKASVHFVSSHVQVRDALDAAMPKLRDLFEQQGLNLANVDVSAQGQQQQGMQDNGSGAAGGMAGMPGGGMGEEDLPAQASTASRVLTPEGLSIYA